jgi:hypothetical protein
VLNIICSSFILNFVQYFLVFMKYHSHSQDCIRAIDGTQIDARVSRTTHLHFHGRKCTITQNVMCVVDMDLCFTYVYAGWEGSAHDARIFTI